jgi:bacterioferritin-associated ferredoxin
VELDDTVCYCFHISKRKIVNFIRITKPRRASQLSECGGAGTGCGWCVNYLKRSFAEAQAPAELDAITPAEYARQRAAYIKAGHGKPAAGAIPLPNDSISESEPGDPGDVSPRIFEPAKRVSRPTDPEA